MSEKSTCTCNPELPWDCDNCYTARIERAARLKTARRTLAGIRAETRILDACAANAHESSLCRCAGAYRLEGVAMYREALALARRELSQARASFYELRVAALT